MLAQSARERRLVPLTCTPKSSESLRTVALTSSSCLTHTSLLPLMPLPFCHHVDLTPRLTV